MEMKSEMVLKIDGWKSVLQGKKIKKKQEEFYTTGPTRHLTCLKNIETEINFHFVSLFTSICYKARKYKVQH